MRRPGGKRIALVAGAVAIVLVAVGGWHWKDVYCHLFLDPRLVGRWSSEVHLYRFVSFDRLGNVQSESLERTATGIYRIDGKSLIITWPDGDAVDEMTYRVAGGRLTVDRRGARSVLRRTPEEASSSEHP